MNSIYFIEIKVVMSEHHLRYGCKNVVNIYFEIVLYEGGSICNENPFITPSTNALGSFAICQTKDQSVAVKMVHETLFYLSKFNKLHTF